MNQFIAKDLNEDDESLMAIADTGASPDLANILASWQFKALLILSLIVVLGFVSVVVYNWIFNASISPLLGVLVGFINGSLVTWCMMHVERIR